MPAAHKPAESIPIIPVGPRDAAGPSDAGVPRTEADYECYLDVVFTTPGRARIVFLSPEALDRLTAEGKRPETVWEASGRMPGFFAFG